MRLGACFLMAAAFAAPALMAQGRRALAWEQVAPLDWRTAPDSLSGEASPAMEPSAGPASATVMGDGTLRLRDRRGIIRLRAGLPGRPLRAWRDGGLLLPSPVGTWPFPVDTPLARGLGGMQWCAEDFRPFLKGLLWILEDGETFLTVAHPATGRVIHLPLPPGRDLLVGFLPDRLLVMAGEVDPGAPRQWSIPWMGLLPRLAALGPHPNPAKAGTALQPFPNE